MARILLWVAAVIFGAVALASSSAVGDARRDPRRNRANEYAWLAIIFMALALACAGAA